jgi:hypothetical protein
MVDNHHPKNKSQRKNPSKPSRALDVLLGELLRRAERLRDAIDLYETVVSTDDYEIDDEPHARINTVAGPALDLERLLRYAGYKPATGTVAIKDSGVGEIILQIGALMVELRMSRHAEARKQRAEVLAGWSREGNGGLGFAAGVDKELPRFGDYGERLAVQIELLRKILEPTEQLHSTDLDPEAIQSLRRVGQMWVLRYHDEQGNFPVNGNKFLGLLPLFFTRPNRDITIAELMIDPKRKIEADSKMGGDLVVDHETLNNIQQKINDIDKQLSDINQTMVACGVATEGLLERKQRLEADFKRLTEEMDRLSGKRRSGRSRSPRMITAAGKAYQNILRQKNEFIKNKLTDMPRLQAHLSKCLLPNKGSYAFRYAPPWGEPGWHVASPRI